MTGTLSLSPLDVSARQPRWSPVPVRAALVVIAGCFGVLGAAGVHAACLTPPGDVTADGATTVVDVQCLIVTVLWSIDGQTGPVPGCLWPGLAPAVLADHNCDGVINVGDAILAAGYALGLPTPAALDTTATGCPDACESDLDGDGDFDWTDCAPLDPAIHGGAVEICNGYDDSCDGLVDAGAPTVEASCASADACDAVFACPAAATPGGLVITEVMPWPQAVPVEDGQWVEVYNGGAQALNLRGYTLSVGGQDHVIDPGGALIVPPGRYAVLASRADPAVNGGLWAAYAFEGLTLPESQGHLSILDPAGLAAAAVSWPPAAPVAPGTSLARTGWGQGAAAWVPSTRPYGLGDRGTPGGPNADVLPPSACVETAPEVVCEDDGCGAGICDPDTGACSTVATGGPTWDVSLTSIGNARARDAVTLANGDTLLLVNDYANAGLRLVRVSPEGAVLSNVALSGPGPSPNGWRLNRTASSSLVVAGRSSISNHIQGWMGLYSNTGQMIWSQNYSAAGQGELYDAVHVSGVGYFACGYAGTAAGTARVIRTGFGGGLVWQRTYGNSPGWASLNGIVALPGGDLFVVGRQPTTVGNVSGPAYAARLSNAAGDVVWEKYLPGAGFGGNELYDVVRLSDGDLVAVGRAGSPPEAWVIRMAPSGAEKWSHTYGEGIWRALVELPDGTLALAGRGELDGIKTPLRAARIDLQGALLWEWVLPGVKNDSIYGIDAFPSGAVVFAAGVGQPGFSSPDQPWATAIGCEACGDGVCAPGKTTSNCPDDCVY